MYKESLWTNRFKIVPLEQRDIHEWRTRWTLGCDSRKF
jgi:hypothetical protein